MKAYPEYKDSGVEWLGEVPAGWETPALKTNTYIKARVGWKGLTSDEFQEDAYAYLVTGSDFGQSEIDWSKCYQVDQTRYEDDPFIHLQDGDLLITKDGTIGKLAFVRSPDKPACLNSGIFVLRPLHGYTTEFLFWVLSSPAFKHFIDLRSYGSTIIHLYQNVFEDFRFPVPPLSEQRKIAAFLDREVAKIDDLIEEQRRLIALLAEKRQATISHAVTKGLNPNAKLKPSGIDWLGDVPEGWDVVPLKHICTLLRDGTHLPPPRVADGVRLLSVRNIQDNEFILREDDSMISCDDFEVLAKSFVPRAGDVVLAIVGATLGKSALIPENMPDFHIQRSVAIFRTIPKVYNQWLNFQFQSDAFQRLLWASVGYSAQPGIYLGALEGIRFSIPPLEEQAEIISNLSGEISKLDGLANTALEGIQLLQERRSALISAAVTGKIDLRDFDDSILE